MSNQNTSNEHTCTKRDLLIIRVRFLPYSAVSPILVSRSSSIPQYVLFPRGLTYYVVVHPRGRVPNLFDLTHSQLEYIICSRMNLLGSWPLYTLYCFFYPRVTLEERTCSCHISKAVVENGQSYRELGRPVHIVLRVHTDKYNKGVPNQGQNRKRRDHPDSPVLTPWNVCAVRDLLGGASFVSLAGQHTLCWQNCDNQAVICKYKCLYLSYRPNLFLLKSMSIYEQIKLHNVRSNLFSSIWPIEDKQEMWWPAKHSTERPPNKTIHCTHFKGWCWSNQEWFPHLNSKSHDRLSTSPPTSAEAAQTHILTPLSSASGGISPTHHEVINGFY